tara:strand:- start:4606 stop:4887 length:282 start_codon:yes stop_codon:yes gene_type:complete
MHMLEMLMIRVVRKSDGVEFYGHTPDEILTEMKLESWDRAKSVLHFKKDMAFRVEMMGTYLVFWDASSFLYALQDADLISIEIQWSERNEKKK